MGRRMHAGASTALALAMAGLLAGLLAGCDQLPTTVALEARPDTATLPAACLGAGLDTALGYVTDAVPLTGVPADVSATPTWQNAALQLAPSSRVSAGAGPYTLCSYFAGRTTFATQDGDDTLVCVLVAPSGAASLVSARTADADNGCAASTG